MPVRQQSVSEFSELFVGFLEVTFGRKFPEFDSKDENVFHCDDLEIAFCCESLATLVIDGDQDLVALVLVVHSVGYNDRLTEISRLPQCIFELTASYLHEDLNHTVRYRLGLERREDLDAVTGREAFPPELEPLVLPVLACNLVADLLWHEEHQVGLLQHVYEKALEVCTDEVHADDRVQNADGFALLQRSILTGCFYLLLGQSPTPSTLGQDYSTSPSPSHGQPTVRG